MTRPRSSKLTASAFDPLRTFAAGDSRGDPGSNADPEILANGWATPITRSLVRRRLLPEIHLAKREFLNLAGGRLRELSNEVPNARYLVGSEPLSTELCQLLGAGVLPSLDLYKCDGHLAPFMIGYADIAGWV